VRARGRGLLVHQTVSVTLKLSKKVVSDIVAMVWGDHIVGVLTTSPLDKAETLSIEVGEVVAAFVPTLLPALSIVYLAQPAPESPDSWSISREIAVAQASRRREITFQWTLVTSSAARTPITQRLNLTQPFIG